MNNDAVSVAPHLHTIVADNDKVRILEVEVKPGDHADIHAHPDNVIVVLQGGTLTMTSKDGTAKEVSLQTGAAFFSSSSEHIVDNHGTETVKVIQVEIKDMQQ